MWKKKMTKGKKKNDCECSFWRKEGLKGRTETQRKDGEERGKGKCSAEPLGDDEDGRAAGLPRQAAAADDGGDEHCGGGEVAR